MGGTGSLVALKSAKTVKPAMAKSAKAAKTAKAAKAAKVENFLIEQAATLNNGRLTQSTGQMQTIRK